MKEETKKKILDIIRNEIYVPEAQPRPNSEFHLGFNACQTEYAESKIKALKKIESLFEI